ncbi:hypothetical protein Tco_0403987, partial [Tanacetum coccineum]
MGTDVSGIARYRLTMKVGTILGIKEVVINSTLCILQQVVSSGSHLECSSEAKESCRQRSLELKKMIIKTEQMFSKNQQQTSTTIDQKVVFLLLSLCCNFVLEIKSLNLNQFSESSSRCFSESRRKTHHNLRRTSVSEERTKIRMMESVSIGKWLTDSRRPSLNEDLNILAETSKKQK